MARVDTRSTATAQWRDTVRAAAGRAGTRLTDPLEAYLVFALMRFAERTDIGRHALALAFLEACQAPSRHARQLRDTGDECLLVTGLFPQRAHRRRVPFSYYVDLGRSAYETLAAHGCASEAEPYDRLAERFVDLVTTLHAMRACAGDSVLDPLDAAEMARQTGSHYAWDRVRPGRAELMPRPQGGDRRH